MNKNKMEEIISASLKPDGTYINGYYTGGVSEELIKQVELELGVQFPEDYRWFLKNYGNGGSYAIQILGITHPGTSRLVEETLKIRKFGTPDYLVAIEDCDEYWNCLDVSKMNNGICPVVNWSFYDKDGIIPRNNSFEEFLIEQYQEALDSYSSEELEEATKC